MFISVNNRMKKFYLLFVLAAVGFTSCGRNYTCPVYSKAKSAPAEEVHASVKKAEKDQM
jgi:hypothetical protein